LTWYSRPTEMRALFPDAGEVDPLDAYGRLERVDGRPTVRLNMIASVDGAAYVAGRSGSLGGTADKDLFATLRALADVIVVGAATMRVEGYGPARLADAAREWRRESGLGPVPPIAVVTRACCLEWRSPFFTEAEQRPIVITAACALPADRAAAGEVADVVVAGDAGVDLDRAVRCLGELGYDNVLAEDGPGIAAQLAADDLVDELCLTVSPMLVGGDARRILSGRAALSDNRLELTRVLTADGYLFLRYRRP
jgi:riboflavin biosynthesis pyrimidine reductase